MALAGLCTEARKFQARVPGPVELSYMPLIVDHKLRPGSSDEAQLVSKRVQKLMGSLLWFQISGASVNSNQV